jgi:hypothetical protein
VSGPLRTAAVGAALLLTGSGCGSGSQSAITVQVAVTTYANAKRQTQTFTLGCRPLSGTLPLRHRVCADIARHKQAMLDPVPARSTCAGGPMMPVLTISTTHDDKHADFVGSPGCGWPGGTALSVYFAAAQHDVHALDLMEPRLRCDDNATLLARPTPWASVTACVRGLWTPRTAQLIRLAERIPPIASLQPQRLFPTQIGARRCAIPAGGPFHRQPLQGMCSVSVKRVWSTPTITFAQAWPLTTNTSARSILQVTVVAGRAQLTGRRGTTPPQLWP